MPEPQPADTPQAGRSARHDLVVALVELLQREQQELTAPRADVLEALVQEKQTLCKRLQPPRRGSPASTPADDAPTRALIARAQRLNAANASLLAATNLQRPIAPTAI
jgi:hypothetical protein